jgi:hypothetical protein
LRVCLGGSRPEGEEDCRCEYQPTKAVREAHPQLLVVR